MLDCYKDIFNVRGQSYHLAMVRYPAARDQEFANLIRHIDLHGGEMLLDVPSGGGYLRRFFSDAPPLVVSLDSSFSFCHCSRHEGELALVSDMSALALSDHAVDVVVSLAGLHHMSDRPAFYREAQRVLRPGGRIVVADVLKGSDVDRFLNGFVDEFNSMGHQGEFLDDADVRAMADAGLRVVQAEHLPYHWCFESTHAMADFCKLLFGIDGSDHDAIVRGIADHLGFVETDAGVLMNWSLQFIVADK